MKKTARLFIVIFAILVMLVALTSCDEQQEAVRVLNKLDTIIKEADSFSLISEMRVEGKSEGRYLTVTQTTTQDISGKNGTAPPAALTKVVFDYDYQNDKYDSQTMMMQGYNDEYTFRHVALGSTEIKLKSPVTKENVDRYIGNLLGETVIAKEDLSYTKEEDGSITVIINRLDSNTLQKMGMNIGAITPGYIVVGATVTVSISSDYSTWQSRVDYAFEKADKVINMDDYTPSATTVTTFSGVNSTTVDKIDLQDYNECDDVGIIDKISDDLTAKPLYSSCGAIIKKVNSFTYHNLLFELKETDTVIYRNDANGFSYQRTILSGDEKKETTYLNGEKKDGSFTSYSTDAAEHVNVYGIITANAFTDLLICDVERLESDPNSYSMKIYIGEDYPNYADIKSISLLVTYEDGFLCKMKVMVRCYAPVNGERTFQNINYDIEFFNGAE